jgi:peptide/nickel transport system ATP-binding protein/oligopeptide transport system ATP-binding protein
MIFQEPMTSLNPVLTIGFQIAEALIQHRGLSRAAAEVETICLLDRVRIPAAKSRFHEHPHRFSGGMRQRVMIAMALACKPRLLIADEPTTALDVTIQAQILDLLKRLNRERNLATVLITHDLGVVAEVADRVLVMYAGRVVEQGSLDEIFYDPQHPYTWGLLGSLARIDQARTQRLPQIRGVPPSLVGLPAGCSFRPRCPHSFDRCVHMPDLAARADREAGHLDRCWLEPERKRELREVEGRIGLEEPA